ncbi:MAG TPA: CopD family protein, partial [Candidatus Acidoferrum sp.]|nr:CopD family protein [Candidatus Acidoferrum sp.]
MTNSAWDLWTVACKWLQLLASAGIVGGSFGLLLAQRSGLSLDRQLRSYLQVSALLGAVSVPVLLLLQIGGIEQSGFAGMFDLQMGGILLQSQLGNALRVRELAYVLVLVAAGVALPSSTCSVTRRWSGIVALLSAASLLGTSFALTGHVSELSPVARILLVLHVLAVFAWIGALYPLLMMSRAAEPGQVQRSMRRFGVLAVAIVGILVVTGTCLATQLLPDPLTPWATSYGRILLLKLAGVGLLLLLAATNKLALVPRLQRPGLLRRLQVSITAEMVVALAVLAVTAWLTTLT